MPLSCLWGRGSLKCFFPCNARFQAKSRYTSGVGLRSANGALRTFSVPAETSAQSEESALYLAATISIILGGGWRWLRGKEENLSGRTQWSRIFPSHADGPSASCDQHDTVIL